MTVYYDNPAECSFEFDEEELIKTLTAETMKQVGCPYDVSVNVNLVNAEEIQRLNAQFRDIDSVTDVLSFPMNEYSEAGVFDGESFELFKAVDPDTDELLLGDIVLCDERIFMQADEYGHSLKREFSFLVVHSLLHLCGFDHIEDSDREVMEKKQKEILDSLNITR